MKKTQQCVYWLRNNIASADGRTLAFEAERSGSIPFGGSNNYVRVLEQGYSSAAVEAKGSSPLEVRKTFSMVLLEVRILPYTPNNCARSSIGLEHMPTKHEVGDSISSERTK